MRGVKVKGLLANKWLQALVVSLFSLFWHYHTLDNFFHADTLILLPSSLGPETHSFSFWNFVFSHQVQKVQYRPISFFFIPFILGKFIGWHPQYYHILDVVFFILSTLLFGRLLDLLFEKKILTFLGMIFFVVHPVHYEILTDSSLTWKYILPMNILLIGLIWTLRGKFENIVYTTVYMFFLAMCLMIQEGTLLFPFVITLFAFCLRKMENRQFFILFAPMVIYLVARVFVWGVPGKGIFEVALNPLVISKVVLFYIAGLTNFLVGNNFLYVGVFCLAACLYSIYSWVKIKNRLPAFSLLSIFIALAPFLLLVNHHYRSRAEYGVLGFSLLLVCFLNTLLEKFANYKKIIVFILFAITFVLPAKRVLNIRENLIHRGDISSKYRKNLKNHILGIVEHIPDNFLIHFVLRPDIELAEWYMTKLFSGFLATNFPKREFKFNFQDITIWVIRGNVFYGSLVGEVSDFYDFRFLPNVVPLKSTSTVLLNLSTIEMVLKDK